MPFSDRFRLSLMMFLNYAVWGAWYVTLNTYLTRGLKFSGTEAGVVFGTTALASMISPFFVGLIADRYFPLQKVLAALHLLGAAVLYTVTLFHTFGPVYWLMLVYCLLYFPTIGLTNSLALQHVSNAGRDFPLIRVFGTLGWIAIGLVIGGLRVEQEATPFLIASGISVAMAAFSLLLPDTPPRARDKEVTLREVLGLDALVMMRERSFLVFAIASVLACIPLTFYFSFTNTYLNDVGVQNAAGKMTLGQVSEVGMMLLMPLIFRRVTVKAVLTLGLLAWSVRYALLALGNPGASVWMFYIAILLHGVCYDFFFMTGQLYTDQQAPPHLRSAAQGLITFLTYGVGMFVGSVISGRALDHFTVSPGVVNWKAFWLTSAAGAALILLMISTLFRSRNKVSGAAA